MKSKILTIALAISIILNILLGFTLGFFVVRAKKILRNTFWGPPQREMHQNFRWAKERLDNETIAEVKAIRDSIFEERQKILDLLKEASPDSAELEKAFLRLTELRQKLEWNVFNSIRKGISSMPSEKRKRMLERFEKHGDRKGRFKNR